MLHNGYCVLIFMNTCTVDPVAVSIEEPSYTITPSEDSVAVCVIADSKLDQSVTINLHSSCMLMNNK